MTPEERFWSKTKPEGDCLVWTAYTNSRGYGAIGWRRKVMRAHRVAYELAYGPFDEKLCVCHKCDNPRCVKPEHLFLGTHLDNMTDAKNKGRLNHWPAVLASRGYHAKGEKHHAAVLTAEMVLQAREMRADGATLHAIANHFGVKWQTIYDATSGLTWIEVGGPITKRERRNAA